MRSECAAAFRSLQLYYVWSNIKISASESRSLAFDGNRYFFFCGGAANLD